MPIWGKGGVSVDAGITFVLKNNLLKYREYFLKHFKVMSYPSGTIFSMEGMPTVGLYYLVEGRVYVYTTNNDGYVRFIGSHEENTIFNLDSLRPVKDIAVVTTKAFTKVKAISLSVDDLIRLAAETPELYKDFLLYQADVLRLMCYDAKEQSIHDVYTRLIHFFLLYTQNTQSAEIPLSQYRIASAINASRVQVARICSLLKQQELIDIRKNKIIVKERSLLKDLDQGYEFT